MIRYIILLMFGVAFISCEKTIDVDITSEPPIVVNALFSDDSTWRIRVDRAWGANDGAIYNKNIDTVDTPTGPVYLYWTEYISKGIDNARVDISSGSGEHITLDYDSNGYYVSPQRSHAGESYVLSVSVPGHPLLSSSAVLPQPVQVDTAYMTVSPDNEYVLTVEWTDVSWAATYEIGVASDDNASWQWSLYTRCDDPDAHLEYYITPTRAAEDQGGTSGPSFWSISDWNFQGQKKKLIIRMVPNPYSMPNSVYKVWTVRMRTLSDEFARYRASSVLQKGTANDPFAEPVLVFNNISNGVGIFAGYSITDYHFTIP